MTDVVCLNGGVTSTCVSNFEFFLYDYTNAYHVSAGGYVTGTIGFGPTVNGTTGFVTALMNQGTIGSNTMQTVFPSISNGTKFLNGQYTSTLNIGGTVSSSTKGKSSAEHSLAVSSGLYGWILNLDSYTFNGNTVPDSTARYLRISSLPYVVFPSADSAMIVAEYMMQLNE